MGAKDRLRAAAVAGLLLTGFLSAFAQNWTLTSAPITNWSSIASSADGRKLAAVTTVWPDSGQIYSSADAGSTWQLTSAPNYPWTCVGSSADGVKLIAGAFPPAGVWLSTNSGVAWTATIHPSYEYFVSAGCSGDGNNLLAVAGSIYTSTNRGVSWLWNPIYGTVANWTASAASASGTTLLVLGYMRFNSDTMLSSTNWGLTWEHTWLSQAWSSATSSADGRTLAATSRYGYGGIYTSADYGATWSSNDVPNLEWVSIASSADGKKLIAAAVNGNGPGPIYTSSNAGKTWLQSDAPSNNWCSVTASADGCRLIAAVNGGGIYTWQTTPSPKLNIAPSGGGLRISWIVPSMPFVLQETADLNTPDWTAVPMTPILNLTNLHHEVTVPLSSTNRFYRLKLLETASQ